MKNCEILRSSFTSDGQRLFLEFTGKVYRLSTRWYRVADFSNVWDACDAFEAIEMMEGDLRKIGRIAKKEIHRVPRNRFFKPNLMARIDYLINSIDRRCSGLRLIRTGSKGAVENWVKS